jgi:hypothetical protein
MRPNGDSFSVTGSSLGTHAEEVYKGAKEYSHARPFSTAAGHRLHRL